MADQYLNLLTRIADALEALVVHVASLAPGQEASPPSTSERKSRKPRATPSDTVTSTALAETPAPDEAISPISDEELHERLIELIIKRYRAAQQAGVNEVVITETLAAGLGSATSMEDAPTDDLFRLSLALQRLVAMSSPDAVADDSIEVTQSKEGVLIEVREAVQRIACDGRLADATAVLASHTGTMGSVEALAAEQLVVLLDDLKALAA